MLASTVAWIASLLPMARYLGILAADEAARWAARQLDRRLAFASATPSLALDVESMSRNATKNRDMTG